jgi:hypothetical protein
MTKLIELFGSGHSAKIHPAAGYTLTQTDKGKNLKLFYPRTDPNRLKQNHLVSDGVKQNKTTSPIKKGKKGKKTRP